MHPDSLRRALADHMGQKLTPATCAAIEMAARAEPDRSIPLEQFEPLDLPDNYVIAIERFVDALPELKPLHERHWLETEKHRHGLTLAPNYDAMAADDRGGRLLQFTVRHRSMLVGNLRLYIVKSRHTGGLMAVEDTLYIDPDHRDGMLGLKLLRYAEACLKHLGVESVDANSKTLNSADVLLRRLGYTPVAIQFHKILKGA